MSESSTPRRISGLDRPGLPTAPPLDTLRLSQADQHELVAWVERQGHEVANNRRRLRVDFHGRKVFGRLSGGDGSGALCTLVPRNLSAMGFSFVHGVFVNIGMRCTLTLPMLGNRWCEVQSTVRRCRHMQGIVHEVSVIFDEELDLRELVSLTPAQSRRLDAEALAGRGLSLAKAADDPADSAQGASRGRVLVVDPDTRSRTLLAAALRIGGYATEEHTSNHSAREATAAAGPGSSPTAVVLAGVSGPQRAGVAELRYDPVALASHFRRLGLCCPILLLRATSLPLDPLDGSSRHAALAGVTEVLAGQTDPEAVCRAVGAHVAHAEACKRGTSMLSLRAGQPGDAEAVAAFARRLAGFRERLRRPGTARQPELLRRACEELVVEASKSGYPAVADAARELLQAIDEPAGGSAGHAITLLDEALQRVA